MADYLYYCVNCNNLVAEKYDDDMVYCSECNKKMIPLHVDEDSWDEMTNEEKRRLLERHMVPQVRKGQGSASSFGRGRYGDHTRDNFDGGKYAKGNSDDRNYVMNNGNGGNYANNNGNDINYAKNNGNDVNYAKKNSADRQAGKAAKKEKGKKKHGLLIAAIIVGAVILIGAVGGTSKSDRSVNSSDIETDTYSADYEDTVSAETSDIRAEAETAAESSDENFTKKEDVQVTAETGEGIIKNDGNSKDAENTEKTGDAENTEKIRDAENTDNSENTENGAETKVDELIDDLNPKEIISSALDQPGSYEEIYEEYAQMLRDATPGLIEEYNAEVQSNNAGLEGKAEIANSKVEKLAEITTEGVEKMADFMMFRGSGNYDEYESWSKKLYDVYDEEGKKIYDEYLY